VSKLKAIIEAAKRAGIDKPQPPRQMPNEAARQGIRLFHGSPYDFPPVRELKMPDGAVVYQHMDDAVPKGARVIKEHPLGRFDMSKIGTGEGYQMYGRGLYFAEAEDVARNYRNELSPRSKLSKKGTQAYEKYIDDWARYQVENDLPDMDLDFELDEMFGDGTGGVRPSSLLTQTDIEKMKDVYKDKAKNLDLVRGEFTRDSPSDYFDDGGFMYEVNIDATPDDFLDYNKPLSEQSEKVKKAIKGALESKGFTESQIEKIVARDVDGQELNAALSTFDEKGGANRMLSQGIKGIKYLDQRSRAPGKGTSNYTVFDDKLIDIAKKYGVSIPIAAYIAEGIITPEEAQAVGFGSVVKKSLSDKTDEIQQGIGSLPAGDEMVAGGDLQFLMNKLVRLRKAADDKDMLRLRKAADDKVPVGSTAKSQGAYASWGIHNDSYEKYNPATGEMDDVELPDYALIEKLYVPPEQRGAAKGRQLLVEAVDEIRAEHGDIGISLTADPFGEGKMDTEDLVKYYEDMGFELNGVSDTSMTLKYPIELN